MTSRLLRVTVGCTLATVCVFAQAKPSFEVASIKPSERLESGGSAGFQPGGRFRPVNYDAIGLLQIAFGSREHQLFRSQIIGAPDWLGTVRWDITAKVSSDFGGQTSTALYPQMPAFVQSLLEDRFKLKVHHDTRELPVFALRPLRNDGRLGPQMRRSTAKCPDELEKCSLHFFTGRVSGGAMVMTTLVGVLSSNTERVVIDETGLDGAFDVLLEWSLDQSVTDKPSIFGAVEEELGLKLESTRAPVDALVIDHIERPSEN